ncbi:hypothetical protein ACLMJK_007017 [Lecanora helva]
MPQSPGDEHHSPRVSSCADPPNDDAVDERRIVHDRVSDISRTPSPEQWPIDQQLMTDESSSKVPTSTTSPAAGVSVERRPTHYLRNWWLEIGACFTFTLALSAIVLTLRPHQGKPLPQWPFSISINSLISIYVVVLKAAILFVAAEGIGQLKWQWFQHERPLKDIATYDSASRGPLGSILLLWTLGPRYPLASCGAFITVLMLAIDPFAQQIIRYHGCIVNVDNPLAKASVPRTNHFRSGGSRLGPGELSIGPDLQPTINAGIFSPGGSVTPLCSTGNCSFPHQYNTLGYCGGCTDITSSLAFIEQSNSSDGENGSGAGASITSSLPSGLSVNSTNSDPVPIISTKGYHYNLAVAGTTSDTGDGKSEPSEVVEFILAKNPRPSPNEQSQVFNETCHSGNSSWFCLGYGAARCTLNPCIRTYTASIDLGIFQEKLLSQTNDTSIWASTLVIDTSCISPAEHSMLVAAGYAIDPAKRWLPYNLTFNASSQGNSTFPSSMLQKDHECIYAIDSFLVYDLWEEYLAPFFEGTVSGATNEYGLIDWWEGPQTLQKIYNFGNITLERIDSIFRNISDSLSNHVRQNGNSNHSTPAQGIVSHDATCLEVRWGWLALPAGIVLATIIFFAITLFVTRPNMEGANAWKSSPLPLLFHGLRPSHLERENSVLHDIKDMELAAKKMNVRLAASLIDNNLVATGKSSRS